MLTNERWLTDTLLSAMMSSYPTLYSDEYYPLKALLSPPSPKVPTFHTHSPVDANEQKVVVGHAAQRHDASITHVIQYRILPLTALLSPRPQNSYVPQTHSPVDASEQKVVVGHAAQRYDVSITHVIQYRILPLKTLRLPPPKKKKKKVPMFLQLTYLSILTKRRWLMDTLLSAMMPA